MKSDLGPKFQELSSQPGEDLIKLATNFTKDEFCLLWFCIESKMRQNWNAGSGQSSNVHPMDAFLFTIAHCQYGSRWADESRSVSDMRPDGYRALVVNVLKHMSSAMVEIFADSAFKSMSDLVASGQTFGHNPHALYVADATVQ